MCPTLNVKNPANRLLLVCNSMKKCVYIYIVPMSTGADEIYVSPSLSISDVFAPCCATGGGSTKILEYHSQIG